MQTCFFEDDFLENFHPLTLTRPVYDLRIGIFTLGEKWNRSLGVEKSPTGQNRSQLQGVFGSISENLNGDSALWINPRFMPEPDLVKTVKSLDLNCAIVCDGATIAARVDQSTHKTWLKSGVSLKSLSTVDYHQESLQNIWQLFQWNGEEIQNDLSRFSPTKVEVDNHPNSTFINPDNIYVETGAKIEAGAILIADDGPIFIGKDAQIMANSVIRGAAAICENSVVKMGAKIYEDTTLGPVCKVGGEISNVIFHSYTNKGHDGYAGNSIFGQWCNIGADTNTSNLKNNYGTVKFRDWKSGKEIDTGQQFIGTVMGDHSKTGINAMLNTGTLCGVCCNLFSDGYPPKYVPSFSWVSGSNVVPYHFDKAIEAMERMMERRNVDLTPAYKEMMRSIMESNSESDQ